jgi:hypothetical protein
VRSLAHESVVARTWTQRRDESWDAAPAGDPPRRATLRRAFRQGLLRPALSGPARIRPLADEQVPADHDRAKREQQTGLPDPAGIAPA